MALNSLMAKPKLFIWAFLALPNLSLNTYSRCGLNILAPRLLYCLVLKGNATFLFLPFSRFCHICNDNSSVLTLTSSMCRYSMSKSSLSFYLTISSLTPYNFYEASSQYSSIGKDVRFNGTKRTSRCSVKKLYCI